MKIADRRRGAPSHAPLIPHINHDAPSHVR
jgi:hypothetical protein